MVYRIEDSKALCFASIIDDKTIEQARETAALPFVHPHIALMPDAHFGYGSAVGTVIPTVDAIIPAAVGVDIGCGMIAARTTFTYDELKAADVDLHRLRMRIQSAIPMGGLGGSGYNHYESTPYNYNGNVGDQYQMAEHTWQRIVALENLAWPGDELDDQTHRNVDLNHSPKWREQLGSLGGGNHFIELCIDEQDTVWMFLHSGSRGVGNKIATKHIKIAKNLCKRWHIQLPGGNTDLAYLPVGVKEFSDYLRELNWAQKFALANREEMMDRFAMCLAAEIGCDIEQIEAERINTHHNYTKREYHGGKDVWVTRKGAVDAHEGVRGLIPGSMGTRSYVTTGKGNAASLCSAPHGAGRVMSRTQAEKTFTAMDLAEQMAGIEYRVEAGKDLVDEIPLAYKPIDQVMTDAFDLVSVDHILRQVMNVKGLK